MKRIQKYCTCFIIFCITGFSTISGQQTYDIRLVLDTMDCMTNIACYDVQLRSANATTWGLAGQNYRLYYDASVAAWQSGISTLPPTYQNFTLVQDVQDVDASAAMSHLSFEATLGFLNYTMDLNNTSTGGIDLPGDGSWVTTSNLCFLLEDNLVLDPNTCFEVVWARDSLTSAYGTAFVEVSEWVGPDNTTMATANMYDDLVNSDGDDACITGICFPPTQYDIRLEFDSIDCINKVGCFDVQLRSSNGIAWGLAGQNYRLYYDASLAAWQSGVSVLPDSSYQTFTLIQDIQDVDASATNSNLAFEGTLGFLNYTMDLINPSLGGITIPSDGSWVTTSQLCFTLEDTLLDNPSTCLEAIWARDTLTAAYATSFVEVAEWVQADSTQMADGVVYDDLDSLDGNGSCFDGLCAYDYGDLPDVTAGTGSNDYQTLTANNGPGHVVISGLTLGSIADLEPDGQPSPDALGDGSDEDALTIFSTLDISPGMTFRLPFSYTNTTGDTAHVEGWIDWNGDGDFDDANEMVLDVNDGNGTTPIADRWQINIPSFALTGEFLGLRIRISNQDNMTPYGTVGSGEVEDYLIGLDCKTQICIPANITIQKSP